MTNDEAWLLKEKYNGIETTAFASDKARLANGEPLAYVIGHIPFLDAIINLDSHPLIPRPETEYWTERAIEAIRTQKRAAPRILDLCAGSGAIGVAVLKAIPSSHVTFAEIDRAHLPTIAKNLDANGISCTRYQIFQSDLFSKCTGTFDFILCNPPYIDPALNRTEASVTAYEPHRALYGGEAGIELIENIIQAAAPHLSPHGELWIEHEPEQSKRMQMLAHECGFDITTEKDQYGIERFSIFTVTQ